MKNIYSTWVKCMLPPGNDFGLFKLIAQKANNVKINVSFQLDKILDAQEPQSRLHSGGNHINGNQ